MSILIDKNTRVLTQGITGKTGQFHTKTGKEYANGKACYVAGVTPKKGGQSYEGIPICEPVKEAKAATGANVSVIYVPPPYAAAAIDEAVDAAGDDLVEGERLHREGVEGALGEAEGGEECAGLAAGAEDARQQQVPGCEAVVDDAMEAGRDHFHGDEAVRTLLRHAAIRYGSTWEESRPGLDRDRDPEAAGPPWCAPCAGFLRSSGCSRG